MSNAKDVVTQRDSHRQVVLDSELERGVWQPGRYYVQTTRFDYLVTLEAVTPMSLVVSDVYVVFESGPYDQLRAGKAKDAQKLCDRGILDRAGSMLFLMP
jgi:hypothetical protein